ncbi:MAG TPA: hypothetical protein VIU64_20315 [Polyangia bacterium]
MTATVVMAAVIGTVLLPARTAAAAELTRPSSETAVYVPPAGATTVDERAAAQPLGHRIIGIDASVGVRGTRLTSLGLDPFSRDDGFVQAALALAYRAIHEPNLALSVGVEWDYGLASSSARDARTSLEVHELAVALCGRVPLSRRFAAFARLTPGAARVSAEVTDGSALASAPYTTAALTQVHWLPSVAASAGLAFRMASVSRSATAPVFDYWLTAEAGYHYAPSYALELRSEGRPAASRDVQPLALGDLSLGGGFARLGIALTF